MVQVSHQNSSTKGRYYINRYRRQQVISTEKFTSSVLHFLRQQINNRVDCATIVREARHKFRLQRIRKPFDQLFSELIFSLFEIITCEQNIIEEEINHFIIQTFKLRSVDRDEVPWTQLFNITFVIFELGITCKLVRYAVNLEFNSLEMYPMLRKIQIILPLIFGEDVDELDLSLEAIHRVYRTPNNKIRLFVLMLVLYVTLQMQKPDLFPKCRDSLKSIKLVFRTIRQPFVTLEEIIRFFSVSTGINENDSRLQVFLKKFIEYFPKSTGFLAPRSLKHLARCEVRKHMGKAGSLPSGVWNLQLPATLQNYLLIQNSKEEHYPKFVSSLSNRKRLLPQNCVVKRVCR